MYTLRKMSRWTVTFGRFHNFNMFESNALFQHKIIILIHNATVATKNIGFLDMLSNKTNIRKEICKTNIE